MITLSPSGQLYSATFPYDPILVDAVKVLGFTFDPAGKRWVTPSHKVAETLQRSLAYSKTPSDLLVRCRAAKLALLGAPEMVVDDPLDLYPKGLKNPDGTPVILDDYQVEGVRFMAAHESSLMAWPMRSGKSVITSCAINAALKVSRSSALPVLIICPAHLKRQWYVKTKEWLIDPSVTVGIAQGSYFPPTEIVIINYDILDRHKEEMDRIPWAFVFVDELKRIRNVNAKRTKCIIGGKKGKGKDGQVWAPIHGKRRIGLDGTPLVNKPQDLWAMLNWLDPKNWPSLYWFQQTYCEVGKKCIGKDHSTGRLKYVRDIKAPERGSPKLNALNARLNSTIMSRLPESVLNMTPPVRQVIEVDVPEADEFINQQRAAKVMADVEIAKLEAAVALAKLTTDESVHRQAILDLQAYRKKEGAALFAIARQQIALAKVPYVAQILEDDLYEEGRKFIVFAHHKKVIEALYTELDKLCPGGVVRYYGDISEGDKQAAEKRFRDDPTCRIFIGGITAASEGLDLAVADDVIFAEEDPVPSNMAQCAARAKKRGKVRQNFERHIVATGSIDSHIAKLALAKQVISDNVLDSNLTLDEPVDWLADHQEDASTPPPVSSRPTEADLSITLTPPELLTVTEKLKLLSANPKRYRLSDVDVIVSGRLALNQNLTGRGAAMAAWIVRKYLPTP